MDKDHENEIKLLIYTELEELFGNLPQDIDGKSIVAKLLTDIESRRRAASSAVHDSKERESGGIHDITGFKSVFNSESPSAKERENQKKEK